MPVIAVDLGYSAQGKTCGIAWSGCESVQELAFGECISRTIELIDQLKRPVLILEAVLSTYHQKNGNPDIRGQFEKGRGWYYGPGVTTFAAALEFLSQLDDRLSETVSLPIFEGLLSFKKTRTTHADDAKYMLEHFLTARHVLPLQGSKPILSCLDGPPKIVLYSSATGQD